MSNLQDILNESDSNDLFYETDNSIKEKKTATAMNPQKMPASLLIFLHQAYKSLTKASAALDCPDEQNKAKTF